ncbi:hypothetical protein [Hirschia litorea]|uniref:Uncharacterized protein n=1 Tax=Hirschia litorea TaxID=1199156 RepID=A0ABW2ILW4_9PROT
MSLLVSQSVVSFYRPPVSGETQKRESVAEPKQDLNALIRAQLNAKETHAKAAELEAQEASKEVQSDPEREALSRKKNQARESLDRIVKQFKIIKAVWANDPKEMARQLGRLAQDLKDAVKIYADAAKALGELSSAAPNVSMVSVGRLAPSSNANEADERNADQDAEAAQEAEQAVSASAVEGERFAADGEEVEASYVSAAGEERALSQRAVNAYGDSDTKWVKAENSPQAAATRENLEFIGKVRGIAKKMEDELTYMKKKAIVSGDGKADKSEAFLEADEVFDELKEDLTDFEVEVRKATPIAGTMVSVKV